MAIAVLAAAALVPACSANPLLVGRELDAAGASTRASEPNPARDAGRSDAPPGNKDSGNTDDGGVNACESAGGTCVGASVACVSSAPQAAQDCNNVAQADAVCCLTLQDAGTSGPEAGPVDAGPRNDGGVVKDGGAPACASAGGTCIDSSTGCGNDAPPSAQDCPHVAGASFCCISPL